MEQTFREELELVFNEIAEAVMVGEGIKNSRAKVTFGEDHSADVSRLVRAWPWTRYRRTPDQTRQTAELLLATCTTSTFRKLNPSTVVAYVQFYEDLKMPFNLGLD